MYAMTFLVLCIELTSPGATDTILYVECSHQLSLPERKVADVNFDDSFIETKQWKTVETS